MSMALHDIMISRIMREFSTAKGGTVLNNQINSPFANSGRKLIDTKFDAGDTV